MQIASNYACAACLFTREIVIPPAAMVKIENKKVPPDISNPPNEITKESINKIIILTLIPNRLLKNNANRSVPHVLISNRNIKPVPKPTNIPPIMELYSMSKCNRYLNGLK